MKKIFFVLIAVWFASCPILVAQFDTQISNYWATTNYFNPAYAGSTGNLEVGLMSRLQWIGIDNAPRTTLIMGQMPIQFMGRTHGVGISMYNDKHGLFSSSVISGQYAYKKDLWKGKFSAGIQLGLIDESFKGSKVKLKPDDNEGGELEGGGSEDPGGNDEGIPLTDVGGKSVDVSLGLFYSKPKWYAGLSVTHLLKPQLTLDENYVMDIPRTYYFTAGYNIQLNNPLIELRPSVLVKTMEMASLKLDADSLVEVVEENTLKAMMKNTQIDVSLRMIYNKKFWGGLSWRKQDAVVVMLGARIKMFEVGYAYDFPISNIIKESSGSHEIFLKYIMDLNLKKGMKNKHKSVRIL